MPNSLQDAIAGIVYRKVLARPDRFPEELREAVAEHQGMRGSTWTKYMSSVPNTEGYSTSWERFVRELGEHGERLPEFLAEDSD